MVKLCRIYCIFIDVISYQVITIITIIIKFACLLLANIKVNY